MPDDKPPIDPEAVAAWQVPAPMSNKVYVNFDGYAVRLVFAEQGSPDLPPAVRSAVTMAPGMGVELARILHQMLAQVEEAMAKAQQSAAASNDG